MAARISEIFLYKEFGKVFFFIKNPNITKKNSGGWEGRGCGCGCGWGEGARVSDFFYKGSKSKKTK